MADPKFAGQSVGRNGAFHRSHTVARRLPTPANSRNARSGAVGAENVGGCNRHQPLSAALVG